MLSTFQRTPISSLWGPPNCKCDHGMRLRSDSSSNFSAFFKTNATQSELFFLMTDLLVAEFPVLSPISLVIELFRKIQIFSIVSSECSALTNPSHKSHTWSAVDRRRVPYGCARKIRTSRNSTTEHSGHLFMHCKFVCSA